MGMMLSGPQGKVCLFFFPAGFEFAGFLVATGTN